MIIDAHLHVLRSSNSDNRIWEENDMEALTDTPIEELIQWLKSAGIEKAVIMGQDMSRIWNSTFGEDYVMEIYKKYSDFFIPLV